MYPVLSEEEKVKKRLTLVSLFLLLVSWLVEKVFLSAGAEIVLLKGKIIFATIILKKWNR